MRRAAFALLAMLVGVGTGLWLAPKPLPLRAPLEAARGFSGGLSAPLTLLVMGEDITYAGPATPSYGWNGNTDTLILVRLDPEAGRVVLLSLPRDTYALIPGRGYGKLNSANPLGGPELARRTVEGLLGVRIDRYVLVNLFAVERAVDLLGGVRVYIPERMDYEDRAAGLKIHFAPGWHRLTGKEAAAYLRFRHDALGDIGRVQRQQAFLLAFLDEVKDPRTWARLPELWSALSQNVRTDLRPEEVGAVARFLQARPKVLGLLLPGRFWNLRGVSYWRVDPEGANALVRAYFLNQGEGPGLEGPVRVAVRGPGAERVAARLRGLGLRAFAEAYQVEPAKQTCLLTNGDLPGAKALAERLGVFCVAVRGTGSPFADYTLVLGPEGLP